MPKTDEQIDKAVNNVVASSRMEGLEPTEEDIAMMRGIMAGELDVDEEVARLVAMYKLNAKENKTGTDK